MASLTLIIVATAMAASTKSNTQCHADSYLRLAAAFPDAVKYVPKTSTIDFCPDNTCQRFTSHSKAPCEVMSDFLFVFLRYFSTYQTLKHWRGQSDTNEVATQLLPTQE